MIVEVLPGMTLADVALRWYGDAECVMDVARINGLMLDWVAKEKGVLNVAEVRNRVTRSYEVMETVICTEI